MKIVVSGSSTGIGRALVERLIARGHTVWGLARSTQPPLAGDFFPLRCDVAVWPQVQRAFTTIAEATASLDAVITCAGIQGEVGPALSNDPEKWSATVRVNLDGTYYVVRAAHALLEKRAGRAKVICFSGGGASKARPNFSAYGVAKTGVVRLVETIADESKGAPLDINALAPGAINTRLTDEVIALGPKVAGEADYAAALKQKQSGGFPVDRTLDVVEFLLSEKSDGITGRLLSAPWDPLTALPQHKSDLADSDIYTLRRIAPEERGKKF